MKCTRIVIEIKIQCSDCCDRVINVKPSLIQKNGDASVPFNTIGGDVDELKIKSAETNDTLSRITYIENDVYQIIAYVSNENFPDSFGSRVIAILSTIFDRTDASDPLHFSASMIYDYTYIIIPQCSRCRGVKCATNIASFNTLSLVDHRETFKKIKQVVS